MKKKVLLAALIGLLVISGVYLYGNSNENKFESENQPKSLAYKRVLDYSSFDEGLKLLDEDRIIKLDEMILDQSIETIQNHIQNNDFGCEELVLFYINRIKQKNDEVSAVLQLNKNALIQARKIDEKIKNGESIGELFGVVILIKDNISSIDMNTSTGNYALRNLTTKRDSFAVAKLKEEDAIILGKANLSEWSNFMSIGSSNGFSTLGGQTVNPYGEFDVGGSSSGSCVGESLNFATVTIGSETSGSLIYPAGQNSVVALKPTTGLISRDLIIPITEAQDTAGIISRNVEDLKKVFNIAVAYDENDNKSKVVKELNMKDRLEPLHKDYLKGKKLGYVNYESNELKRVLEEFKEMGVELVEVKVESNSIDILSVLTYGIKNDVNDFLTNVDVISEFKSLDEIVKYNEEDPEKRMPYGQYFLESGVKNEMTKEAYEILVNKNEENGRNAIDKVLLDNDIEAIVSISNELSGIYAPANYPAMIIPAGYKSTGEPFGVTIVGSKNDDFKLLQMGYSYEQFTNYRVSPTK